MKKQRYWEVTVYTKCEEDIFPYDTYYIVASDDIEARVSAVHIALGEQNTLEETEMVIVFCEIALKGDVYYDG